MALVCKAADEMMIILFQILGRKENKRDDSN
jgi:hypothetical protein